LQLPSPGCVFGYERSPRGRRPLHGRGTLGDEVWVGGVEQSLCYASPCHISSQGWRIQVQETLVAIKTITLFWTLPVGQFLGAQFHGTDRQNRLNLSCGISSKVRKRRPMRKEIVADKEGFKQNSHSPLIC
jgi:hypothetical protein